MKPCSRGIVVLGLLAMASCAPQQPRPLDMAPTLSTSARIEVATVRGGESTPGIDATALLKTALRREFEYRGIAWSGSAGERYGLDVEILRYQAGNAFQRWLLPGLGATVLTVRGILRGPDGAPAGGFEHGRGVYAGGAFTIGAWERIFDDVASDIAHDLDNRIRRRGFTIALKPWSAEGHDVPQASVRRDYGNVAARDLRADRSRIGTRTAAFGVSLGDVFLARDVDDYMTEAVTDQLRAARHRVGVAGAPSVEMDVTQFQVHTDTTLVYWDVVAEIAADLRAQGEQPRHLSCRAVERTWVWPTETLVTTVLDRCLADLMSQLARTGG